MNDFNPAKIRVIFMDIGGVLLTNGWGHESREKAAKAFDFDYQEMEILHNFIYNVFEIGSISLDEYLDTILFYQDRKFSKSDFIEFMFAQSIELPQMLEWVKEWKKKLICLFLHLVMKVENSMIFVFRLLICSRYLMDIFLLVTLEFGNQIQEFIKQH